MGYVLSEDGFAKAISDLRDPSTAKAVVVGPPPMVNGKVVRDTNKCIGCGVCAVYCPTRAWTRSKEHYFRLSLLGRTGKKNPRMGVDFLKWADEESILKIIKNTYEYLDAYQDRGAVENKEHIGYIVDRT